MVSKAHPLCLLFRLYVVVFCYLDYVTFMYLCISMYILYMWYKWNLHTLALLSSTTNPTKICAELDTRWKMAEIGQNFLSLNKRNLGESILNIITYMTNISKAKLWVHKKGGLPMHTYMNYMFRNVDFCDFLWIALIYKKNPSKTKLSQREFHHFNPWIWNICYVIWDKNWLHLLLQQKDKL